MSPLKKLVTWLEERVNLTEIFSFFSAFGLYYGDIDTRDSIEDAFKKAKKQELPPYGKWPHILGILTFLLFIFQIITGMLLAFYYQPTSFIAYETTREIIRNISFGWLIFNIHRWGANLLILILIFRIVRFFYDRVWKKPRELFWIIGIAILIASIGSFLTGTLLPFDQNSYWSTVRNLEIIEMLPLISSLFNFLIGGSIIEEGTLIRFYFLHIVVFPLFLWILFYFHFSTVRRVGLSEMEEKKIEKVTFYPSHIFSLLTATFIIIFILVSLSVFFPFQLMGKADPLKTPYGTGPSWFLLFLIPVIEYIPWGLGGLLTLLVILFLFIFPFVGQRVFESKTLAKILTFIFVSLYLILSLWGFRIK